MQVMFCAAREIIFSDMFLVVEANVDKIYSSIGHSTYIASNVSFMLFQKLYLVRIQLAALQEVHAQMHTRTGCRLVVMFLSLLQSNIDVWFITLMISFLCTGVISSLVLPAWYLACMEIFY
jgi:hypothetical protein